MMEPQPKAPRLPAITPPQPPPSAISAPPRPSPEVVDIVKCNHNKGETHARTLWNKLEQLYARKTENNKLFLIKQMMRLKYTDGSPITDHLNAFQGIINHLAGMGIKFDDELQGLWLLGFFFTVRCLGHRKAGEKLKQRPEGTTMRLVLKTVEKKENRKKNYNNQKNKHKKDDDGDENTEVNTTTDEFLVCYDYDMVNLANDDLSWILESGATCHVATRKILYSAFTPGDFGMELVLNNVKHVPRYEAQIYSQSKKGNPSLNMTHPKISKSIVNAVDNDDMTELWNKRLGHMIEKGMSILSKKNMLSSVHDINLKNCYHCLAGKQTRLAFKSRSPFRIENILDLVHSDVKRSRNLKQIRNRNFTEVYFLTFIYANQKLLLRKDMPPTVVDANASLADVEEVNEKSDESDYDDTLWDWMSVDEDNVGDI
ncbi:putative RNA-directed DNA polymerase [Tanacetum coccineum]